MHGCRNALQWAVEEEQGVGGLETIALKSTDSKGFGIFSTQRLQKGSMIFRVQMSKSVTLDEVLEGVEEMSPSYAELVRYASPSATSVVSSAFAYHLLTQLNAHKTRGYTELPEEGLKQRRLYFRLLLEMSTTVCTYHHCFRSNLFFPESKHRDADKVYAVDHALVYREVHLQLKNVRESLIEAYDELDISAHGLSHEDWIALNTVILSRLHHCQVYSMPPRQVFCLIPGLDYLNTGEASDINVLCVSQAQSGVHEASAAGSSGGATVCLALADIEPNQELLVQYGSSSLVQGDETCWEHSVPFLLTYGFVLDLSTGSMPDFLRHQHFLKPEPTRKSPILQVGLASSLSRLQAKVCSKMFQDALGSVPMFQIDTLM